jgi:threonine dehydrogenase-like Zn-dependent dehydrogenase
MGWVVRVIALAMILVPMLSLVIGSSQRVWTLPMLLSTFISDDNRQYSIVDAEGVLLLDTIGTTAYGITYAMRCADAAARSDQAAVLGCGPLGLSAVLILKSLGLNQVSVFDPAVRRMEVALEWGASSLDPSWSPNAGRFGLVVEASGSHSGRDLALELVETGGAVLLLGENDNPWPLPESPRWRRKDCAYVRSFYFPLSAFEGNMRVLRDKRDEYRSLVDRVYGLGEIETAFEEFVAGRLLKPMIQPGRD